MTEERTKPQEEGGIAKGNIGAFVIFRPQNPLWVNFHAWKLKAPQASVLPSAVSFLTRDRARRAFPKHFASGILAL